MEHSMMLQWTIYLRTATTLHSALAANNTTSETWKFHPYYHVQYANWRNGELNTADTYCRAGIIWVTTVTKG